MPLKTGRLSVNAVKLSSFSFLFLLLLPLSSSFSSFSSHFLANDRGGGRPLPPCGAAPVVCKLWVVRTNLKNEPNGAFFDFFYCK